MLKRYILIITLLSGAGLFAQLEGKETIELSAGRFDVYDAPDREIRRGDSIFNSKNSTLKQKTEALMLISNAYSAKRDYQKSLKVLLKAKPLALRSGDPFIQATILNGIAVVYQQLKMYDKAIEVLDDCDRVLKHKNVKDSTFLRGTSYVVRGLIYKEQVSCDLALNFFDRAIAEYKKGKSSRYHPNLSVVEYNKGYCCLAIPDYKRAIESFNNAMAYADLANIVSLKAFAKKGLAEVYSSQGEFTRAITELNEAFELGKNTTDLVLVRTIYEELANNYLALNDVDKYMHYRHLFLYNQALIKEAERIAVSDSIEDLTSANAARVEELNKEYFLIIGVLLMTGLLIVSLLFYYLKKVTKHLNRLKKDLKKQEGL